MKGNFSEIVEKIQKLTFEERRENILKNYQKSLKEFKKDLEK